MEVCFLSMSRPSLEEGLALAASWPQQRIVVQPHLLFPGLLFDRMVGAVARIRREYPEKRWLVAQPLGPDRLLSESVVTLLASSLRAIPLNSQQGVQSQAIAPFDP
jgi:sirohydrochlorin ferrochelatase